MPFYHQLGKIPHKRHTTFKKSDGSYYYEQLFGTIGFDGMSSLMYHVHRPTQVKEVLKSYDVSPKIAVAKNMLSLGINGFAAQPKADYLESRVPVLVNNDCHIVLAAPSSSLTDYFYKNTDCDELLFVHEGSGKLRTMLGNIEFSDGDYLLVPRGMIYQIEFETETNRLFIVESHRPLYTPKRYRNWFGQLLEHSPFCERDLRRPTELETHDKKGDFIIKVKKEGMIHDMSMLLILLML